MKGSKVLLYSGGMDSYAMARLVPGPRTLLFVDMGTRENALERARLPAEAIVEALPLAPFARPDGIVPMRNLILVALASRWGDHVYLGATAGDRVLDKSERFAELASELLTYLWGPQHWNPGARNIEVRLPLKGLTKRQIVRRWVMEGHDPLELARGSTSCYAPEGERACGACKPCFRKWVAFASEGLGGLLTFDARPYVRREILPLMASGAYGRAEEEADIRLALERS